jgi:hypothetical protein
MELVHFERVARLDRDACFPPEAKAGVVPVWGRVGVVVPALPIGVDVA